VVSFVPTTRLSKTLLSSVPRYSFVGSVPVSLLPRLAEVEAVRVGGSVPVSLLPDLLSLLADILSSLKLGGSGVSVVPGVAPLGRGVSVLPPTDFDYAHPSSHSGRTSICSFLSFHSVQPFDHLQV